jgi:hypothetical protein
MAFADGVAPQAYWPLFNSPANYRFFRERGFNPDAEGVTPELINEVCRRTFSQFGKPVQPIGQGDASPDEWRRFLVSASTENNASFVSVWRYGIARRELWPLLHEHTRLSTGANSPVAADATRDRDSAEGDVEQRGDQRSPGTPRADAIADRSNVDRPRLIELWPRVRKRGT